MKLGSSGRFSQFLALVVTALILVGLVLFATLNPAQALYKANNSCDSWDPVANTGSIYGNGGYTHALQDIVFDGHWQPFLHEMSGSDNKIFPTQAGTLHPGTPTDPCPDVPGDNTTIYAGEMVFALYHTDTAGDGYAPGFQRSAEWKVIDCDRNNDGTFDAADLAKISATDEGKEGLREWTDVIFQVVAIDEVKTCGTGNCSEEIWTTMFFNPDTDCDNDLADEIRPPSGKLCFYALAQTPTVATWGGNVQGRVQTGQFQQTISFHVVEGPLAVKLARLDASSGGAWLVVGLTLALGAVLGGGTLLARRRRR